MRIEHVRIRALGADKELQNLIRMVSIAQMRPKANAPGRRPTGGLVAANFERFLYRCCQLWCPAQGNIAARIQTVEMRNMAMMAFTRFHVPIFEPFLQLSRAAD